MEIETQLENRFSLLRYSRIADLRLVTDSKIIPAHKLFLMKNSEWFYHQIQENPAIEFIDIPVNPDGYFETVLDALYIGKLRYINGILEIGDNCRLTLENVVPILKVLDFYGIRAFRTQVEEQFHSFAKPDTVMSLMKSCWKYDIPMACMIIFDAIVAAFRDLIENDAPNHVKARLFSMCPVPAFVSILKHESMRDLPISEIVPLVDEYVAQKSLTEDDMEALATVIPWEEDASCLLFLRYDLPWVPPRIARPLLIQAMEYRARATDQFIAEIGTETSCSRWFPFMWMKHIECSPNRESPCCDLVRFVSEIGDPGKYGFANAYGSRPLCAKLAPQNALIRGGRFVSLVGHGEDLFYGVDFGPGVVFAPAEMRMKLTEKRMPGFSHALHALPRFISVHGFAPDGTVERIVCEPCEHTVVRFPPGKAFLKLEVRVDEASLEETRVLRIHDVEIIGCFVMNVI